MFVTSCSVYLVRNLVRTRSIIFTFHTFYSTHSNCYNNANNLICMVYFSIILVVYFSITIYKREILTMAGYIIASING